MQLKPFALIALTLFASVFAGPARGVPGWKGITPIRKVGSDDGKFSNTTLACESPATPGNIVNHGGRIMNTTVNTYGIFYGNWTATQRNLLAGALKNIGASPYYSTLVSYGVNGTYKYKKSVNDTGYSQGHSLDDNSLPLIVANGIKSGLPVDPNGIYFIFTDSTVNETGGFCTQYCGFHTSGTIAGQNLLYAFIGNPQNCIQGCGPCNAQISPNGDVGVDAMVSVLSHELVETASDPLGSAWYDANGYENADKCAYNYGQTYTTSNGAIANIKIGGKDFLIQQNWVASTQACGLSA